MSHHVSEHVAVADADNVRTVAMRRPEKKNALTLNMYRAMTAALGAASTDDAMRCLLIAGVPGAFCAGNDIGDFMNAASAGANAAIPIPPCADTLRQADCGVRQRHRRRRRHHHAVSLRSCRRDADGAFSTPFTQLGLVPEGGSSLLGPRQIGYHRAFLCW